MGYKVISKRPRADIITVIVERGEGGRCLGHAVYFLVDSVVLTCCVMLGRDGLSDGGWMDGYDGMTIWVWERMFCKADGVTVIPS